MNPHRYATRLVEPIAVPRKIKAELPDWDSRGLIGYLTFVPRHIEFTDLWTVLTTWNRILSKIVGR